MVSADLCADDVAHSTLSSLHQVVQHELGHLIATIILVTGVAVRVRDGTCVVLPLPVAPDSTMTFVSSG